MLRSLEEIAVPAELVEHAQLLDVHYIPTRYPNGFAEGKPADYYNRAKAEEAVDAATQIIRFCRDHIHRPE